MHYGPPGGVSVNIRTPHLKRKPCLQMTKKDTEHLNESVNRFPIHTKQTAVLSRPFGVEGSLLGQTCDFLRCVCIVVSFVVRVCSAFGWFLLDNLRHNPTHDAHIIRCMVDKSKRTQTAIPTPRDTPRHPKKYNFGQNVTSS